MADTWLRYDRMVEQALRGVVRKAIEEAMHRGLPGEHHFYITFHTDRPGVGIADWLHQQYPQEMTIILQHQFWDLTVDDDRFGVGCGQAAFHDVVTAVTARACAVPEIQRGACSNVNASRDIDEHVADFRKYLVLADTGTRVISDRPKSLGGRLRTSES